jgi:hypothetical protein
MPEPRRLAMPVAIGLVGAIIGAVVAVGGLGWVPVTAPGVVAFEGVNLTITYSGLWPGIYGPTHQNACLETPRLFFPTGAPPDCPGNLTGGNHYSFGIFEIVAPGNVSDVFVNLSIESPIPIFVYFCGYPIPPPAPALNWNLSQGFPNGMGCGLGVLFTIPSPAPSFPGGLWFQANMTVHVV